MASYTGNLGYFTYRTPTGEYKKQNFYGSYEIADTRARLVKQGNIVTGLFYTSTSGTTVTPAESDPWATEPEKKLPASSVRMQELGDSRIITTRIDYSYDKDRGVVRETTTSGGYPKGTLPGSPIGTQAQVKKTSKPVFGGVDFGIGPRKTVTEVVVPGKPAHTLSRTEFINWAEGQRTTAKANIKIAEAQGDIEGAGKLRDTYSKLLELQVGATQNWHPETTVTFAKEGFTVNAPLGYDLDYQGWQRTYEKNKLETQFKSGFTPHNPVWLGSLYDVLTGEKGNDRYIKTLQYGKQMRQEGAVGFIKYAAYESPFSAANMLIGYGIGKGAGIVTRGVSRELVVGGSKTFAKFSSKMPSSSSTFVSNIAKTPTMQNFSTWATKGYVPGRKLAEVGLSQPIRKEMYGGEFFQQSTKYSSLGNKGRIFMSPDEVAIFNARLKSSGDIFIGFPRSSGTAGVGNVEGVVYGETFRRGLFGNLKPRVFSSYTMNRQIGTPAGNILGRDLSGLGSFYRRDMVKPVIDVGVKPGDIGYLSQKWGGFSSLTKSMRSGYTRESPIITLTKGTSFDTFGTRLEVVSLKGWSGKSTRILSERPTWGLNKSLRAGIFRLGKNETGAVSVAPKLDTSQIGMFRGFSTSRSTMGQVLIKVPAQGNIPTFAVGYLSGVTTKTFLQPEIKSTQQQISLKMPIMKEAQTPRSITKLGLNLDVGLKMAQQQVQIQQPVLTQMTVEKTITRQATHTASVSSLGYRNFSFGYAPYLPKIRMNGYGSRGYGTGGAGTRYRYREFKIPNLSKIFKGVKI